MHSIREKICSVFNPHVTNKPPPGQSYPHLRFEVMRSAAVHCGGCTSPRIATLAGIRICECNFDATLARLATVLSRG